MLIMENSLFNQRTADCLTKERLSLTLQTRYFIIDTDQQSRIFAEHYQRNSKVHIPSYSSCYQTFLVFGENKYAVGGNVV
jgi:hypothetical protein